MQSFSNADLRARCKGLAAQLKAIPAGLDPERLMLAIAAVESGGADPNFAGHDCGPRHEAAYDVDGSFYKRSILQQELVTRYGSGAAYSYGPWQMMFCNFVTGTRPDQLQDLNTLALNFVWWFNNRMKRMGPQTLAEVGEVWNSGRITPDPDYETKIAKAYAATGDQQ